jgi:hypothetical protein
VGTFHNPSGGIRIAAALGGMRSLGRVLPLVHAAHVGWPASAAIAALYVASVTGRIAPTIDRALGDMKGTLQ